MFSGQTSSSQPLKMAINDNDNNNLIVTELKREHYVMSTNDHDEDNVGDNRRTQPTSDPPFWEIDFIFSRHQYVRACVLLASKLSMTEL